MFFGFIVIGCLTRLFMNRRVYWDKRCFVLFLFFVFCVFYISLSLLSQEVLYYSLYFGSFVFCSLLMLILYMFIHMHDRKRAFN